MPPKPELERKFGPFEVGCIDCDMWFETASSQRAHREYWHVNKKKEEEK